MPNVGRKKGKSHKLGRDSVKCQAYKSRRTRHKNAKRRIKKWTAHLSIETRDRILASQPAGRLKDI